MLATQSKSKKLSPGFREPQTDLVRTKWPRQNSASREAFTVGKNGKRRIYSITSLTNEWISDEEMISIDQAISSGENLHEVFVRNGYSVRKNVLDVYVISLSHQLTTKFETTQIFAKAQNAEYIVRKEDKIYCYGIVRQVYSPEFWPASLNDNDKQVINFSFYTLQSAGFSKDDIWHLLDHVSVSWWRPQQKEQL